LSETLAPILIFERGFRDLDVSHFAAELEVELAVRQLVTAAAENLNLETKKQIRK
jgi:hypothetical protein